MRIKVAILGTLCKAEATSNSLVSRENPDLDRSTDTVNAATACRITQGGAAHDVETMV